MENILRNDLGNVQYTQKYNGHSWYESKLDEGFDCVKTFVRKKYDGGSVKWFRLWRSGYLEHGGTIYLATADKSEDVYTGNYLRVNLRWRYNGGDGMAKTYDYVPDGVQNFYQAGTNVKLGESANSISSDFSFKRNSFSSSSRYRVQVTPIRGSGYSYGLLSPEKFPYLENPDVFDMNNSGFSILASDGSDGYTYQIGGFVENFV